MSSRSDSDIAKLDVSKNGTNLWHRFSVFFLVFLVATNLPFPSFGCPAYIDGSILAPLSVKARQDIRLFSIHETAQKRSWQILPLQINQLDPDGVLMTTSFEDPPRQGDRIAIRIEDFGQKFLGTDRAPCATQSAIEIENPLKPNLFAYLVACSDSVPNVSGPVQYLATQNKIIAKYYDYEFFPNNQLMFHSLAIKNNAWTSPILASSHSDLTLHLDLRGWPTLDFTNNDVASYVKTVAVGSVGMVGSIEFFVKMLFMKFDLKIGTTIGFYGDSAHIPSLIDVPVNAVGKLNPGSGLLLDWVNGLSVIDQSQSNQSLPNVDIPLIRSGWEALARLGLQYCVNEDCVYRVKGSIGDLPYGIDIYLPKTMVERGFFPMWVNDVAGFKKDLGWHDDVTNTPRIGVYFDNSGLDKGRYKMTQWIRLGNSDGLIGSCPKPVTVGPIINFVSH